MNTYRLQDGKTVALTLIRAAERQRTLGGLLPTDGTVWDYLHLVDVLIAEPGCTDFRLAETTVRQWIDDLRLNDPAGARGAVDWVERQSEAITQHFQQQRPRQTDQLMLLPTPSFDSLLLQAIAQLSLQRASAKQWLATLRALTAKGIKTEELEESGLLAGLSSLVDSEVVSKADLLNAASFSQVTPRLVSETEFRYRAGSCWALCRTEIPHSQFRKRGLIGWRYEASHTIRYRHRAMGYFIVRSEYADLLTAVPEWWTVLDERGRVIAGQIFGFDELEAAMRFAEQQISARFHAWGKEHHKPRWQAYSLPGGESYSELLVQLDQWPDDYQPRHFETRNVLIHIRKAIHNTADGRRVMFLDEVQSDWHADLHADRDAVVGGGETQVPAAPFKKEWPLLALKLMLWETMQLRLEGLAWSTPELQKARWKQYGPPEILYRRALPDAGRALAQSLGLTTGTAALPLVRHQHHLEATELGWIVLDERGKLVAGPYRLQFQAQAKVDALALKGEVTVPVIWLPQMPAIYSIPLWGLGKPMTQTSP